MSRLGNEINYYFYLFNVYYQLFVLVIIFLIREKISDR